ncbi:pentapeptide repeat-containing protein [Streptomyces sp. NPDC001307]|uniref:pentapeptide repeat-containing protein n=1 Tax=Streptomyces sp. NPDC001307 TaxID=3364560 RepID=UPI0036CD22ED
MSCRPVKCCQPNSEFPYRVTIFRPWGSLAWHGAVFSGGTVDFDDATFSGGTVDFNEATLSGGTVDFNGANGVPPAGVLPPEGEPLRDGLRLSPAWYPAGS